MALTKRGKAGLFVIGHGAGGGVDAVDIVAVSTSLADAGWTVARVTQPYRVKGRRAPEPPPRLDAAWVAVVAALRKERAGRLVVSGRSSGARVAVRTAAEVAADAVVALAFPLHPPGKPEKSRAEELTALTVPLLVVQGERDAFGGPGELPAGTNVVGVPGDHSLKQSSDRVAATVLEWLSKQ